MFPPLPLIPQVLEIPAQVTQVYPRNPLVAHRIWFPTLLGLSQRRYLFVQELPLLCDLPQNYPMCLKLYCMASGLGFSNRVNEGLLNSRKPSTRWSYQSKWNKYIAYLALRSVFQSSLHCVLDFLLGL